MAGDSGAVPGGELEAGEISGPGGELGAVLEPALELMLELLELLEPTGTVATTDGGSCAGPSPATVRTSVIFVMSPMLI